MAKAINWPLAFREEVLSEDTQSLRCAFRLGPLYYDNHYWVDGEVVDIRVNHLKVRKAVIQGDMKRCPVKELTDEDLAQQKFSLASHQQIITYLSQTYEQPVDENTPVTVVYYKNLPVIPEEIETPDTARPESSTS